MKGFTFPLRQTLEWRKAQLELEENKLRQLVASLEEMALAAVRLEMVMSRAEGAVRQSAVVEAGDLWALAAYRQRLLPVLSSCSGETCCRGRGPETSGGKKSRSRARL